MPMPRVSIAKLVLAAGMVAAMGVIRSVGGANTDEPYFPDLAFDTG